MIAIKNISSKNQSSPMEGPLRRFSLIGTLDPPKPVAAIASNIPVNAKVFFLRNAEETMPNMNAPTIRHWIKTRMTDNG